MTNGAIKLIAPEDFDAAFDLEAVTGQVTVDFPVSMSGTVINKKVKGTIGGGSVRCFARIVTGTIIVLKH